MSTLALMGVLRELAPGYEKATGTGVAAAFAPTAALLERIGAGEAADVAVLTAAAIDELAARGEAEIAVQQVSELMEVPGIDIVGPLPAEPDAVTVFSGALFSASPRTEAGVALLRFLSATDAAPVYRRKGLEPLGGAEPVIGSGAAGRP
jgi:molybdate transport system substrate-binding protein